MTLRLMWFVCSIGLLFTATLTFAADDPLYTGNIATINLLLAHAVSTNLIAGGVVVIGNHDAINSLSPTGIDQILRTREGVFRKNSVTVEFNSVIVL